MIKSQISRAVLITTLFTFSFSFKALNNTGKTNADSKGSKWSNYVSSLYDNLSGEKSGLKLDVFHKALVGYYNLKDQKKLSSKNILSIVDFSLPSTKKRLWIIDMATKKVLYHSLVSHGKNTGTTYAKAFSNVPESHKSSLGFYITGNTYYGKHDLSLRLLGVDKSFNGNAFDRAIVMHGAKYVSEDWIKKYGMLGRSFGCPAIPEEITKEVINLIADGTCLFLYYPDKQYESQSALLNTSSVIAAFNALDANPFDTYHLN